MKQIFCLSLLIFVIARIVIAAEMSQSERWRWNKANEIVDYVNKQPNQKWKAVLYQQMALLNNQGRKLLTG